MAKSSTTITIEILTLVFLCLLFSALVLLAKISVLSQFRPPVASTTPRAQLSPLNASYLIEGKVVTLVHGKEQHKVTPRSASLVTTTAWGELAAGDLNADGIVDHAFIITQSRGGSGTFYYVVALLNSASGAVYKGTNAVLLGDRIAPENISIADGMVTVNYAERKPGEPMTAQPSVGRSAYLVISSNGVLERMGPNTASQVVPQ